MARISAEVEIDRDSGVTEVVRYTAVEDLGRILNPLLVAGQIHGGVVQGLGQVLGEQIVHDESGQMLTASFMDYQMPRAADVPDFRVATREVLTPGQSDRCQGCGRGWDSRCTRGGGECSERCAGDGRGTSICRRRRAGCREAMQAVAKG